MAGLTLAFDVALFKLLLNGTALANVFDNASSSPITDIYLSAHSADPGKAGTQTTNEMTYGSYARVAVARTTGGWTVNATTGIATPVAAIVFPTPTSGSGTITHIGVGKSISGAGYLFASGALTPNIVITVGVPPQLTTASQLSAIPTT
jgi:hypothetical protein